MTIPTCFHAGRSSADSCSSGGSKHQKWTDSQTPAPSVSKRKLDCHPLKICTASPGSWYAQCISMLSIQVKSCKLKPPQHLVSMAWSGGAR